MKYYPKLKGERCCLAPIDTADAALYAGWLNDLEVAVHLTMAAQQITLEWEKEFLASAEKEGQYLFGIVDRKEEALIGNCGLFDLDWVNRTADFGIFIGDKRHWGAGYGEEATRLLLDYAFHILNLHNIRLCVYDYNSRAVRCYEKCGFKFIGKRREAKRIAGKVFDIIYMDVLASEFTGGYIPKLLLRSAPEGLTNPARACTLGVNNQRPEGE